MTIWRGAFYKRSDGSYRQRHSGIVYDGVKRINNINKGINRLGYEPIRSTPYGRNIRSKSQALKDVRSFHQKVPRLLKK